MNPVLKSIDWFKRTCPSYMWHELPEALRTVRRKRLLFCAAVTKESLIHLDGDLLSHLYKEADDPRLFGQYKPPIRSADIEDRTLRRYYEGIMLELRKGLDSAYRAGVEVIIDTTMRTSMIYPVAPTYRCWMCDVLAEIYDNPYTPCFAVYQKDHMTLRRFYDGVPESIPHAEIIVSDMGKDYTETWRDITDALHWSNNTILNMALTIYENEDFHLLPILADAFEDAGINDERILTHCRSSKIRHYRGCWLIDGLLSHERDYEKQKKRHRHSSPQAGGYAPD